MADEKFFETFPKCWTTRLDKCEFYNFIDKYKRAIVFFYNPHSQASKNRRTQCIAMVARNHNPNMRLAAVNCTQESKLCAVEGVPALPTYRMYYNGTKVLDVSPSTAEELSSRQMLRNFEDFPVPVDTSTPKLRKTC